MEKHSCYFPATGRQTGGHRRPLSVRVELQHIDLLQDLLRGHSGEQALPSVVKVAWALLLRCYTGLDELCFGYEEIGAPNSSVHSDQVNDGVAFLQIREGITLADLVKDTMATHAIMHDRASDDYHYNSSVLVRDGTVGATAKQNFSRTAVMSEKCQIRLLVKILKTGTSVFLEYRNSFIPTEQAKNIASTLDAIFSKIFCAPQFLARKVNGFSERHEQQIDKWNSLPLEYVERTIHETILGAALESPDAEAVCAWDGTLSYRELDEHACQLAAHLIEVGVEPEQIVPLCFEKSKWNVVAMLATMYAGGAFLPLDPAYPRERVDFLVQSAHAKTAICSRPCSSKLDGLVQNTIVVDALSLNAMSTPERRPESRANSHSLAYVIPTSGTTGRPKLTMLEHGNFCTGAKGHAVGLSMISDPPIRGLQFAAHSFDASMIEYLTPLMIGGTVCIPDEDTRLNDIAKAIKDMKVTWAIFTPTFVRFLEPSMVPTLKTILLVGEAMSQNNLDTWCQINLVNGYGPSECAVAAASHPNMSTNSDFRNIGYPISSHAWVVDPDDYNQRLPIGCTGELLVEGHIAARGYLHDEEKTSQAFITRVDWATDREFRGYLTGDLVIQNPDGSYNIVGRKDSQVKYHGQRIELLEIEHHINLQPAIKHCLVVLPKTGYCKDRLVAVVSLAKVSNGGVPMKMLTGDEQRSAHINIDAIRDHITQHLPFYMVPTVWIAVAALPQLPSGKLDRKQVTQWVASMTVEVYQQAIPAAESTDSSAAPVTELEDTLRGIWAHVLNFTAQQIAVDQSFLSLGGDSISAMQVMGHCRKKGLGLGVQDILRSQSVSQLCTAVKHVKLPTGNVVENFDENFDLTPIQLLWFSLPNQTQGRSHFNQSFYLRLEQHKTSNDICSAVEELVLRHSMLRARFQCSASNGWQQRLTQDVTNSFRFRYKTVSSKADINNFIEDSQKCLDYTRGPLFAVDLFEYNGEQHLFLVGHHLVIDLVTWRLLLEEFEEILNGGTLLPPALPFQKWAQLQKEHAVKLKLDEVLPPITVPALDFGYWAIKASDNTYGNAGHKNFELDSTLTSQFLGSCHQAFKTEPVEVLLASLIHSWVQVFTDRPVPAIFNEGHGREPWDDSIDISRTVGWFTTLYPVYVDPGRTSTDTVRRVKDFRRDIPGNGRQYFAKRCLTLDGNEYFKDHFPMEISFNYLGQYQQLERTDALLKPLENMAGETREAGGTADVGHDAPRFGLFEISAIVFKGQLKFAFTFNRHMAHQDLIHAWVAECQQTITSMVQDLVALPPTLTRSDFSLLSLSDDNFQRLLDTIAKFGVDGTNIEDVYPCTSMQDGLLLSQSKDAGFYAAVVTQEVNLASGQVQWQKLADAWRQVVQRHASLRTIFVESIDQDEALYDQVVLRRVEPNVIHLEASSEEEALDILQRQQKVSYDNGRSPPHRFTLCTIRSEKVLCCLEISHAIMDGQSMSLLFQDLRDAYASCLALQGPLYSDYVSFLKDLPEVTSLDYWKSYLNGIEVCSFPILNDGEDVDEPTLKSVRMDLANLSILDLQAFCSSQGITLSNVLHTAWALTLSLYVGSNEVTFGYLTSSRDEERISGVNEMVGPLINTIVCRVDFKADTGCLLDILRKVQQDYVEAMPHRHTSLAEVQHSLGLSGGANLFNTALSYRKLPPVAPIDDTKLSFKEVAPIYDPTEYSVSINIEVSEEAAMIDLEYWTNHVCDGQAANIASTFVRALENIVFHAEQRLVDLDHLSGRQWQQIQGWNVMPETLNECVHQRFVARVLEQPNAPAIRGFDGDYTYAQLHAVTDRLARHLIELGVGPEVFVPTCFDKSTFAVVSMLAVLKAGGAAVPLDAKHPKNALELRVEDCEAQVVLTSAARSELFEDVVPDVVIVDSVLLEDLESIDKGQNHKLPCTNITPTNPAFVIFTSGSTGRPKGVILEHAAMVTSAYAHGTNLGVGPGTRFLQFASYTFDNSLEEMFTTLQRGGCVCVPSEDQRMSDLVTAIAELDVNFMDLTPTVAALLNPSDVPTIKGLALGGEALTQALVEQWSEKVHLHGQYGPSEASINSAWKDFQHGGEPTNIGRAIGSVAWVVDPENRNRLMPLGCTGELLIEGPILSRGYLKDPEKTAQAFILDPEWAVAGGASGRRFYCTGDLVYYTSSGEMMYLGRKDSQVKLNGQRIELGEIEHHLKLNLPGDAQSAVELVKFESTKKALVGFLCLSEVPVGSVLGSAPAIAEMNDAIRNTAKEVEQALANTLPDYYVPSIFLPVTSMPMTTSGKLDRKVLRQLAQALPEEQTIAYRLAGKSGRAPSGPTEKTLARLWASVMSLPAENVGADDSFFRLGGDSIGAMRLVTASRKEGIVLTVANVFAQPKLADMAAIADLLDSNGQTEEPVTDPLPFEMVEESVRRRIIDFAAQECGVFPDSIEDIYPCSRLQEGLVALSTKEPGAYVAQTIFRLPQYVDLNAFRLAWNQVIASEAILRTRIIYTDASGFMQVVIRDEIPWQNFKNLEEIDETHRHVPSRPGAPLATWAIVGEYTQFPFFVWTAHHAVYDGWSLPNLLCKVESCYRKTQQGPLVTVPYSRFVKFLLNVDSKASDAFWTSLFEDATVPQFPQLPNTGYKVKASSQATSDIAISRKAGSEITLPSMVRAAWALLLATYSGSDDVIWGETTSGRDVPVPAIEDMVGPTIATSPMRCILDRQMSVKQYLQKIQRQSSEALPFQFAGLQHIRKLTSDTAAACEFQNLLVVSAGESGQDLGGELWDLQSAGTIGTNFFNYALIFNCIITKNGLHIESNYDPKVVSDWLIQRLFEQFEYFVNRLNSTEAANETLNELNLLNHAHREVISTWNSNPTPRIDRCLHNVIYHDQVLLRPSAVAIQAWDSGTMTYLEVDECATRLALKLVSMGVRSSTYVPFCFDKSGWAIIAMLAILKAGAAFVPLDFESPVSRLKEIITDTGAKLILSGAKTRQLCQSLPCELLVVDRDATEQPHDQVIALPHVQADSPAYALFTSGSTGKPKGAIIPHFCIVTSIAAFAPAMNISATSRVLQFSSYTFDACIAEIMGTLALGGTICVPDQDSRIGDLPGIINKFNVNWAMLTPSVVRTLQPSQVPQLRSLVLVGEAMSQQDLLTWADRVALFNGYGPTETSVIATVNQMTSMTRPNNLGRVVTARGWIVSRDNHNVLCPLGAVGELLLEDGGVGSGYLKQPDKTAESFISRVTWSLGANGLNSALKRRFYKTGDLVKYDEDGRMMYLGRKDFQTKVRGQRLEVSEIEHHLMEDDAVQNALATVPTSGPCAKRLVGVVSFKGVTSTQADANDGGLLLLPSETAYYNIEAVRQRLYERLPSYMIPSLWVAIAQFPLMSSSKMDRKYVNNWIDRMDKDTYRTISTLGTEQHRETGNSIETKLQAIFANVLNLAPEDVRLTQSFLHLGGDSISSMQVLSRCRAQGLSLTIADIIGAKSITSLASKVSVVDSDTTSSRPIDEYNQPFDLTPIQKFFFDAVGGFYNHFNQSVVLRLSRSVEPAELQTALDTLVKTHPMLRARYRRDESKVWRQQVEKRVQGSYRLQEHHVVDSSNETLGPIMDDSQAALDIANGPVFAANLFDMKDTYSQALGLIAHHLVIDVVSWGIVLEDLMNILNGVVPPPQSLPYYTWQQQQIDQAKRDSSRHVYPFISIPLADVEYWGMEGKPNVTADTITEDIELSPKDTMLLLGAQDALSTEPLDVFISALLQSFRKVFPDRKTVVINNEGHGRETFSSKQDLSRTIGWFTTMTPIHLPVSSEDPTDIVSTIRWVKDLRERIPGKGRPYFAHRLLTQEGEDRFANHFPPEAVFNYLGRMQNLQSTDALLQRMDGITTSDIGPEVPRFSLFEITALVYQGSIKLSFSYNRHMRRQSEIKQWICECRTTLVDAVDQLLQLKVEPSLSNFKLLPLSYNGTSRLQALLPSGITIGDIEDIYPASPMQQGILLAQLKHPDFYAYYFITELRPTDSTATISPRKIAEAWQIVVHRHPALRTVFIESLSKTGLMDQIVFKQKAGRVSWILDCEDDLAAERLRTHPPADYREFNTPHSLTVCKTNTGKVWIKLEMSHAICDGRSIPNVIGDLARAYEGKLTRADTGPLYSDFIAHILSSSRDADVNYWKTYLSGVEPCFLPNLTAGTSSPHELGSYEVHFGETNSIQAFCKKRGVTLSNVLQLCWALTLHCYVGASDVSFGVVSSGRDVPVRNIEEAAGCFVNMLICRLSFSDESSILSLLETLQTDSVNALSHQSCSLADVQHELQFPALFNTVFTFQRRNLVRDPEKTAITYENVESGDPGEYHVTVNADVMDGHTSIDFGFWKDRVSEAQAANLVQTFEKMLDSIVACTDRDITVADLDFVPPGSLGQVMKWNEQLPAPVQRCVHELIQEQVLLRSRSAKAIESWDGTFTYQELDEITNCLAVHLQSLKVTTETFVPILFEKSAWAVVAIIAVMKAGGAYVPLDPKHPPARLRQLIGDVGAKVVLCSKGYRSQAREVATTAVVVDKVAIDKLPLGKGVKPLAHVGPDNALYCLFTSGTTGMPKGTIITHQAFSTSSATFTRILNMDSSSRVFQFASYTFDASVPEILGTLVAGATICIPSEEERMNDVSGAVRRYKATWVFLTPSVLNAIKPERMPCVRTLASGGEAVPGSLTMKWGTKTNFINAYGPTETTVYGAIATKSTLNQEVVDLDPGTIGFAVAARNWIVHPRNHHKLMPVGSVGELVIEGYTVARGYLNNVEKTATVFITDPEWATTLSSSDNPFFTTRMYKTGDLVRYNENGSITYIGRKDTQIKLNGQRIELGEIEYHVKEKFGEGVQSAVELVAPSGRSTKALAVFFSVDNASRGGIRDTIQPAPSDPLGGDELLLPMEIDSRELCKTLENSLASVLPSYMIPSIFIPIAKMPWTSAGKLDRNLLRNLAQNLSREAMTPYRLSSAMNKRKPATDIEKRLQKLVCNVLNLPVTSVGVDDSFIRLGGDSVGAMRLVSAAQNEHIELSVIDIFKHPKLSDLSVRCKVRDRNGEPEQNVKPFQLLQATESRSQILTEIANQCHISKEKIQDAFPASPLQEAFVTLSIKQAGAYVAQFVLELSAAVQVDKFKAAWARTVQDTDILRTRIGQVQSGAFVQAVLSEDPIKWRTAETLTEVEEEIPRIASDLGAPLSSYTIVTTEDRRTYFVWTLHHALYDGWSMPSILRRVEQIYQNGLSDIPRIPYTRFVGYLLSRSAKASNKFWKDTLAGAMPQHFPQKHFAETEKTRKGRVLRHATKMTHHRHTDITQSVVIRAAWALLLAAYTGSDDVVFGETLTGRDIAVPGITDICGPTLTTVPTRVRVDRSTTVLDLLRQMSQNATDRIPHQHLGLAEIKKIDQDTAATCDFQNLLVTQTASGQVTESMWQLHDSNVQTEFFTYPLVFECTASTGTVQVTAHYDENVISEWQIQRIVYQFDSLLVQLNSASSLRDIRVFSEQDTRLLGQWNSHELVMVDATMHSLFLEQAVTRPHAPAVTSFDGDLTYAELRDLSAQLAQELSRLGAGPDKLVPLCMDKSKWAIVGIMGTLIAGAAYVPLSPEHPIERHRQIIDDCKASIVLCSRRYEGRFKEVVANVLPVDDTLMRRLPVRPAAIANRGNSSDVCYVIFTSGSTGVPKGVVVQHKTIAANSAAMVKSLHLKSTSRVLQFCSFVFDVSIMEILTVLSCGAIICMPSEEERKHDLVAAINKLRVSYTFLTPSVANIIPSPQDVPTLKTLVVGGEALNTDVIAKWASSVHLLNGYGPTEACVFAVTNDQVSTHRDPTSIGRIVPSGRAWVTVPENPHYLAPLGAVGELCVEGHLVTKGYLNDHAKTTEVFIDNPAFIRDFISSTTQTRIYRTGDLVQYDSDGYIHYLGRKDNQVKVAGQRLELGEIEHQLSADTRVRQAVVVMPKAGPGKRKLTAVVTFSTADTNTDSNDKAGHTQWNTPLRGKDIVVKINESKDRLNDLLPSYMVPPVWIALKHIPTSVSAKLDRKLVSTWLESMTEDSYSEILGIEDTSEPFVPANESMQRLQRLWAKVLNIPPEKVTPNKSWLSLGGDSITAMQLLARGRQEGFNLTLNGVLRSKSIVQLARSLGDRMESIDHADAKINVPFGLSPIQQFFFRYIGDDSSQFNQSFTFKLSRRVGKTALQEALSAMVERHSMLRARFSKDKTGIWQQEVSDMTDKAFDLHFFDVSDMEAVVDHISHAQQSLDIARGPVFVCNFFNVKSGDQVLFLAAHHLVIDVVSWRVILGDLDEHLKSGSSVSLPKELPFQTWCEKQRMHAQDPDQIARTKKNDFVTHPVDLRFWGLEKRSNVYGDVERDTFVLEGDSAERALNNHRALRTDVVDLFVAAIIHSFSRVFIDRPTPTVFNESHGRESWEGSNFDLSRTVGWFTTMYPVTIPIAADEDDVIDTVRRVKDFRRKINDNGRPYFAHRFLTDEGRQNLEDHGPAEVLFNYLGKMQHLESDDSLFVPVPFGENDELQMSDVGGETRRMALFEISASVSRGQIQFTFMYNRRMKNRKGIRRWIAECEQTLEEIVSGLTDIENPQPTMSDFPLLPLDSYNRLDKVMKALPAAGVMSYDQVEDIYPCAAMQEGIILARIKDPSSYLSYIIFEAKSQRGKIDVGRLASAWQDVVNRHSALRTVFVDSVCKGGVFDQVVLKTPGSGVLMYSCKDEVLTKELESINYVKLNGKKKPCLPHQFSIVQTNSGRVVVKMEINHAVIDGGSTAIIRADLKDAYERRLTAEEGPLYSDYIKYIRNQPAGAAIQYWKKKLKGLQPCQFPLLPQHSTSQRQLHSLYLRFDRFPELQKVAERLNVTFSNIMLAAWGLILRAYTGSSDVCYGYLTSGRNVPVVNIENAVGAFINMLVARVTISRSYSLVDVFQNVQNDFIESLPHQHCSLAQFQHDLGLSGKALFNTAVSVQNSGLTEAASPLEANVDFEFLDGSDPSEFALTVNVDVTRNDEGVRFGYWTDVVSDEEARKVSSMLAKILDQVIADGEQTIGELDAAIQDKPQKQPRIITPMPSPRTRLDLPDPLSSRRRSISTPKIDAPLHTSQPDWSNMIRSIVSEMVPQIVDQMLAKTKGAPHPTASTVNDMTNQMVGLIHRRASHSMSMRGRPNLETPSLRREGSFQSRHMSTASDAESRINIAADMVAAAGVMATEALKTVPADFVEKKLLTLWSELLDMVEESIGTDDSFFQLGGDSIIAMRLVGAAREEGLSMTVADVFKNPTFADMARVVRVAGEVIDQVMSQAGDGASIKDIGSSSKRTVRERAASAWKDFQSIASENAIIDEEDDFLGVATPGSEQTAEQLFKKWQGFTDDKQSPVPQTSSRPRMPQRVPSQRTPRPKTLQTIHDNQTIRYTVSLLGDPNVDSVISKVQVFKGGISDVLPVTDFQALAITGTLLQSRWMLNHFYLDGKGPLDLRKLKQSAFRIVQAFDILRTVFIPYGDRFLQVVLRKLQPDFIYQETDLSLDDFTTELRQKDCENGPRLGETFVQFVVAKQKKAETYRIFMRISHAQYDGFCFPKILESLQAGYNGLPISSAPSFGNFVRESAKTVAGAHDHWREVLRGSRMTDIVHRYGPNYQRSAGRTVTLKQTLTVPPLSHINITTATVMKSAWAATLARIAGNSDVVFGHVISGRSSGLPDVEHIIGPCLNMVPVRVVYRADWTVLDLLEYIQDQQIANMPYESLGFREMIRHCTDWPDWTNFSSVLQHNQNIGTTSAADEANAKISLGNIEYTIGAVASQEDFADFSITSTSTSSNQVEVNLTYAPNSTITKEYAQNVFDMLCTTTITFAEDPHTMLPSPLELTSQNESTLQSEKSLQKSAEKQPVALPTDTGLSKSETNTLATRLRSAWSQILRDEHGAPVDLELDSDFFQLGGDIMGLAQVTSILEQDGLKVRVEDLLDKSVFVDQVGVLAVERKKQMDEEELKEASPWGDKGRKGEKKGGEAKPDGKESGGLSGLAKKMGLKRIKTRK